MMRLGLSISSRTGGPAFRIMFGIRLFERVMVDGSFVDLDGLPVYMEI